jgi:hypothetical protein
MNENDLLKRIVNLSNEDALSADVRLAGVKKLCDEYVNFDGSLVKFVDDLRVIKRSPVESAMDDKLDALIDAVEDDDDDDFEDEEFEPSVDNKTADTSKPAEPGYKKYLLGKMNINKKIQPGHKYALAFFYHDRRLSNKKLTRKDMSLISSILGRDIDSTYQRLSSMRLRHYDMNTCPTIKASSIKDKFVADYPEGMPDMYVHPSFHRLLAGEIKALINGQKLGLFTSGLKIGIVRSNHWNDFCLHFMNNSRLIATKFGVENNFRLLTEDNYVYLTYFK